METPQDRMLEALRGVELPSRCRSIDARRIVAEALEGAGFKVARRVAISTPEGSARGRLAILATRGAWSAGIEVDRCQPRARSVQKFAMLKSDLDFCVVLLSKPPEGDLPQARGATVVGLRTKAEAPEAARWQLVKG